MSSDSQGPRNLSTGNAVLKINPETKQIHFDYAEFLYILCQKADYLITCLERQKEPLRMLENVFSVAVTLLDSFSISDTTGKHRKLTLIKSGENDFPNSYRSIENNCLKSDGLLDLKLLLENICKRGDEISKSEETEKEKLVALRDILHNATHLIRKERILRFGHDDWSERQM